MRLVGVASLTYRIEDRNALLQKRRRLLSAFDLLNSLGC
jgi:hypothetical protein